MKKQPATKRRLGTNTAGCIDDRSVMGLSAACAEASKRSRDEAGSLSRLLDLPPDAAICMNPHGDILFSNRIARDLVGRGQDKGNTWRNVLVFVHQDSTTAAVEPMVGIPEARLPHRFEREVIDRIPPDGREVFHTLEDLIERLTVFDGQGCLLVYPAGNAKELAGLCAISHLLGTVRLILIAPDRSEKTIARAHSLFPRFLSCIDSGFSEVACVLKQMTGLGSGEVLPRRANA